MRRLLKAAAFLVLAACVVAAATIFFGYRHYQQPGPLGSETTVLIDSGSGVAAIARKLEEAGVIGDSRLFRAAARVTERAGKLRAGEYRFEAGISMEEALAKLARQVPIGRVGRPEEVAYGILYLASDESSYTTGSELLIDGGISAM